MKPLAVLIVLVGLSCSYDYAKLEGSSGGAGQTGGGTGGSAGGGRAGSAGGPAGAAGSGGRVTGTGGTSGAPGSTGGMTGTGGAPGTGGGGSPSCTCSAPLICEGTPRTCQDPSWAEWPMPNSPVDVAAGAPNAPSYTDNGDGTITDNVTGLMWQKAVPAKSYTWAAAVALCPTLTLAGHTDWRLPALIELGSIVDYGQVSPSIDTTVFTGTPSARFWSSTPLAVDTTQAWYVFFYAGGGANTDPQTTDYDVRCVR